MMKVVLLLIFLNSATTQNINNNCSQQLKCRDCLSHSHLCSWCISPVPKEQERCGLSGNINNVCEEENIVKPTSSIIITRNEDFTSETSNLVQLRPQGIHAKLRINQPTTMPFSFQPADNFPVDIYFVMDTSKSMNSTRKQLARLIRSITIKISNMTSSFKIGFGSFVDKTIEPFTSTHPHTKLKPCDGCIPAYGFKNHLNLTTDIQLFQTLMDGMKSSGNVDDPEGGFDAIVQAVACQEVIGWRETSRKIVIFFTDGPYHYAGDAKLAGILEPNDLGCHLDVQGYYTKSTTSDYPSISQLVKLVSRRKISLIIATTSKQLRTYQELSNRIEGSKVGEIGDDASIDQIIYDNYKAIQRSILFKTSGYDPSALRVALSSSCSGATEETTNRCGNVNIGQTVNFKASITAVKCVEGVEKVRVSAVGMKESLVVEVETLCECPCEKQGEVSSLCSNKGKLVCGVCECDGGRYGKDCGCEGSLEDEFHYCRSEPSKPVCSDRGVCECGKCQCQQVKRDYSTTIQYQGQFCQCSNDTCPSDNGLVCSGRGVCECSKCKCESGHKGHNCECSLDQSACIAANGLVCNGKGVCECGSCVCNIDKSYKGSWCEDCPTCQGRCKLLVDCVSCRLNNYRNCQQQCHATTHDDDDEDDDGGGGTNEDASGGNNDLNKGGDGGVSGGLVVDLVEQLPVADTVANELSCVQRDKEGCTLSYIYKPKTNSVVVLKSKDCPEKPNWLLIIGTTVGGVLLMGVVLLVVWKVVVVVYDRNEYLALVKEEKAAEWTLQSNPIYRTAVTSFQNPTFVGTKDRM